MKCRKCGWENKDTAIYCKSCGCKFKEEKITDDYELFPEDMTVEEPWSGQNVQSTGGQYPYQQYSQPGTGQYSQQYPPAGPQQYNQSGIGQLYGQGQYIQPPVQTGGPGYPQQMNGQYYPRPVMQYVQPGQTVVVPGQKMKLKDRLSSYPYINYKMNWYKFLVFFALIAGAVLNIVYGIYSMMGMQYGTPEVSELVYMYYPGMKTTDIVYGTLLFASAGCAVLAEVNLLRFKKNAPLFVYLVYVFNLASTLIYVGLGYIMTKGLEDMSGVFSSSLREIAIAVFMLIANMVYFKKRKELFMN